MAIVCFGRGRWVRGFVEIKILDQYLTLLKMILKIFLVIRQTEILLYKPVLVWILCIPFSQTQVSWYFSKKKKWLDFRDICRKYCTLLQESKTIAWLYFYNFGRRVVKPKVKLCVAQQPCGSRWFPQAALLIRRRLWRVFIWWRMLLRRFAMLHS